MFRHKCRFKGSMLDMTRESIAVFKEYKSHFSTEHGICHKLSGKDKKKINDRFEIVSCHEVDDGDNKGIEPLRQGVIMFLVHIRQLTRCRLISKLILHLSGLFISVIFTL